MYSCAKGGYLGLQCPGQRRILGKSRHMLRLPDGGLRFPRFGEARFPCIAPVQQFQAVQKSLDALELNLVVARTLTADEELKLRAHALERLEQPFAVTFVYLAKYRAPPAASLRIFPARSRRRRESRR